MKAKKGFTLVEILIVVVILGILAAIVIPQFTDASEQAKIASLRSDLQMMRSQIELYKAQHNDELPTDPGHLGLVDALTPVNGLGITDQYGASVAAGTDGAVGPYMREIPSNPFVVDTDGLTGWWFNTLNGDVRANSDTLKWPDHIDF
jgi:general secretion pathway protein G